MKTSFSGHEKFDCKMSWLPLAYKDIQAIYNDLEIAIAVTGLGSNKIKSLKQWISKFTLLDDNGFSSNAEVIFSHDPYLEKLESLWILHTYITQNFEKATLYSLFFNEFFISTFTKESLLDRTQKWCEDKNINMSANTLESDVNILIKMYLKNDTKSEFSSSLFSDLNLLHKNDNEYVFNVKNPAELTDTTFLYIFLYFIRNNKEKTISVKDLQYGKVSLQYTLGLTEEKLLEKLEKLSDLSNGNIVYQEAAGIKQIYINNPLNLNEALKHVYIQEKH
ncbi:MAG: DUF4007 family protein [Sulfurimonas sp.]|jgi:hypothetical protein